MKVIKFFMTLIFISSMVFVAEAGKVGLKIIPPTDDGGARLLSYIIEKMDVEEGRWIRVREIQAVMIEQGDRFVYAQIGFDVDGLKEGHTYRFRVFAVNLDGKGPAGKPSIEVFVDKEDIRYIPVESGPGYYAGRSMVFSALSDAPFAKQALEREMIYRKEELLANLLNKRV